ncbi:MAG: response regulator [Desulfobacteraceae bacterium]|nr:response regulator [Desulfobacteraceae bacterium]
MARKEKTTEAATAEKTPKITTKRGPGRKAGRKLKILYVDDEQINLINFETAFGKDYEIITASAGQEALKIFKEQEDIAMVVSDQRMPGMSGVELLEKIYKLDPVPVRMILTAYKDIEDIIGAINQGQVYRYILKPWEDKEVRPILKQGATSTC